MRVVTATDGSGVRNVHSRKGVRNLKIQTTTPGLSVETANRASDSNGELSLAEVNQSHLVAFGKLAAQETVHVATTALGVLLIVCGLILFGCWLNRNFSA